MWNSWLEVFPIGKYFPDSCFPCNVVNAVYSVYIDTLKYHDGFYELENEIVKIECIREEKA